MTSPGDLRPPVVRLGSPGEIADAIPYLLGYRPTESVVLVSLRGERRRFGLTLRSDLPGPDTAAPAEAELADELAARLALDDPTAALVVCVTEGADEADDLPRRALVDALVDELHARDVAVADALLVRAGRWWAYSCDLDCCPREGTPLPDAPSGATAQLAAEVALHGRAVLPDRAALAATVAGPAGLRWAVLHAAAGAAKCDLARVTRIGDDAEHRAQTLELVRELERRRAEGGAGASDAEAARVVVGLRDVRLRDAVLVEGLREHAEPLLGVLGDLARCAVDDDCAPVCSVVAGAAYGLGDGSLAAVALDRALAAEPDYSLARLLAEALERQVPPAALREAWCPGRTGGQASATSSP